MTRESAAKMKTNQDTVSSASQSSSEESSEDRRANDSKNPADADIPENLDEIWARHHAQWRNAAQVTSHWDQAGETDPELLTSRVTGQFFDVLNQLDITLLITREYEHLLLALSVDNDKPRVSFFNMPHPSGLAVDRLRGIVHVASTRNPNQVFDLKPVAGTIERLDAESSTTTEKPLVPIASNFYPGCMYMHDLAVIDGELFANSVGQNAIVRLEQGGAFERVWWPECIEKANAPVFGQNHIQLNSIAAGNSIETSFFSASSTGIEALRPGDPDYPVDKRGVIFDGKTRQPLATGLTRPHSARLFDDKIWVDNSGYGELGFVEDGSFKPFVKLPGWTRGLCMLDGIAFVGTSRVIPRFSQYAPGLNVDESVCGIHAIDLESGEILGSLTWPKGNQIFAIESVPRSFTKGFPFTVMKRQEEEKLLFYTFMTSTSDFKI